MSVLSFVGDALNAARGVISEIKGPDDVEKMEAKAKLLDIQATVTAKILEHESIVAQEQGKTIREEAKGGWLQRNWRPTTALVFVFIIANNYVIVPYVQAFGGNVPTLEIPGGMWALLTTMITGYTISRGGEKVAATFAAMKAREES